MNAATTTTQTADTNPAAVLAKIGDILKFSSFLTAEQCALLEENAEVTLNHIARTLKGGAQ